MIDVSIAPVGDGEFSLMMKNVGPFESAPRLAVAVSGGGDSMALVILVDRWIRARSGRVVALTVDHGLRKGSSAEARRVGQWMAGRGIEHHILEWRGAKPSSGVQAAARTARYRIMSDWALKAGVLHLLTAHHLDDQAETFLIRLSRGSGVEGLSGMAAVTEIGSVRLLRPLLGVGRKRLKLTLELYNQQWIEDPSNHNPAFARSRVRSMLPALDRAGISPSRLADDAWRMAWVRLILESAVSKLLASCCRIYPYGYCEIVVDALTSAPPEVSRRALSRILRCVGGGAYPPHRDKVERLYRHISGDNPKTSMTLAGCIIKPMPADSAGVRNLLVCREARGMPSPVAVIAGMRVIWDNRFVMEFSAVEDADKSGSGVVTLRRLGGDGWSEIVGECPDLRDNPLPAAVRLSLPALSDERGIFAVVHLNYRRPGGNNAGVNLGKINYRPRNTLSGQGFFLA